jgi:hypothetical protein
MTTEYDFTKHLIAQLFAKAAEAIEAAPRKDLEEILTHHENLLVGILNNSRLLHVWTTHPGEKKLLNAMGRGFAYRGLSKDTQALPSAVGIAPGDAKSDGSQAHVDSGRSASNGKLAA